MSFILGGLDKPFPLLRGGLALYAALLASVILLLRSAGSLSLSTYTLYQCAEYIHTTAIIVLYETLIGSLLIHDAQRALK